jgi:hypothetical protein
MGVQQTGSRAEMRHTHTWQMLLPTARLPSHFAARTTQLLWLSAIRCPNSLPI